MVVVLPGGKIVLDGTKGRFMPFNLRVYFY
jgi:hypothetical protein